MSSETSEMVLEHTCESNPRDSIPPHYPIPPQPSHTVCAPSPEQLLSDPEYMGCGHVKFMALNPEEYGITKCVLRRNRRLPHSTCAAIC